MNCAHCGAPISLEEKYCPHCGQPNIQAVRHSEDMEHYNREFENTRRGVLGTLRAYKGITARLIIFIIAVIFMIIAFCLMNGSYSIHRNRMHRYALDHSAEILAQVDEYMEHKDYVSIANYADHYALNLYSYGKDDPFEKYYPVFRIAANYAGVYTDLMSIATSEEPSEEKSRLDILNSDLKYVYDYIYNPEEKNVYDHGDPELADRAIADAEELIDALFIRYYRFTPEEMEQFHTLSDARRSVVLEDKFNELVLEREGADQNE